MTREVLVLASGREPFAPAWTLPRLLHRSGLVVDVVTTPSRHLRSRHYLRELHVLPDPTSVVREGLARTRDPNRYGWVIAANDGMLFELGRGTAFADDDRLRLAPVVDRRHLVQLDSKAALSLALAAHGIPTPDFRVVADSGEAVAAAEELGYPVMVKGDSGGGGAAVRFADDADAVVEGFRRIDQSVVVVQRWLAGVNVDVSAVFFDGVPVHFTYARVLSSQRGLGPSRLRCYTPTQSQPGVLSELRALGRALGLHGFTNISAIEAGDGSGRRWYYEADARPNVWCTAGAEVGDDPVVRLRNWLELGRNTVAEPTCVRPRAEHVAAHLRRSPRRDLLLNRNGPWRDFDLRDPDSRRIAAWTLLRGPT